MQHRQEIPLTQGKVAFVDRRDYAWLAQHKWHAARSGQTFYAVRNATAEDGSQYNVYMHREILGLKRGDAQMGDHRNHNGLDNRRSNLRPCMCKENQWNSRVRYDSASGAKGVTWHAQRLRWRARITVQRKTIHLGLFDRIEDATKAYKEAAKHHHGEFACLGRNTRPQSVHKPSI
jgi:hypothetical protein